ncbi:hypothetical protein BD408DRAFT_447322 [Parasitella parasitica]|nr:hypothetical protein BD408DRAFT_447322 [Parasitella parasitica]
MRLRIRHSEGTVTLPDVNQNQTVSTLKDIIRNTIHVDNTQDIQISGAYPPKQFTDMNIKLTDAGLRDGDTLNIKVLDAIPLEQPQQPITGVSKTLKEGSVQTADGVLQLRVMDDDNSCLFRSIGNRHRTLATALTNESNQVIVDGINNDPDIYSDATLGQSREKYMEWIQKPTSWGGAIELAIFSDHFGVEIDSIDVQTGRIDKFGEGSFEQRVLIVYSGIHYDALALAPSVDSSSDFDQTRFSVDADFMLDAAKELTDGLRKSRKFTDIANFTIKCEQCNTGLKGEKDAQNHATDILDLRNTLDPFDSSYGK